MRGEEDSRCFQISRIALETVSRFRRKRKDEESKKLAGLIGIARRDALISERDYHPWDRDHLVIDTAGRSVAHCVELVFAAL
jgi:hypothetical protein